MNKRRKWYVYIMFRVAAKFSRVLHSTNTYEGTIVIIYPCVCIIDQMETIRMNDLESHLLEPK